jgi:dihydroorotate dehydrogenase
VGTANFQDPRASLKVLAGLEKFMVRRGLTSLKDLIGKMQV